MYKMAGHVHVAQTPLQILLQAGNVGQLHGDGWMAGSTAGLGGSGPKSRPPLQSTRLSRTESPVSSHQPTYNAIYYARAIKDAIA